MGKRFKWPLYVRDLRATESVRILKEVCRGDSGIYERMNPNWNPNWFSRRDAGIHKPLNRPEFLKRNAGIHGPLNRSEFLSGMNPLSSREFTFHTLSFSRLNVEFTISRIHCEFTVSRIQYRYSLFISRIHFESTISIVISIWIHCLYRECTMNALSF